MYFDIEPEDYIGKTTAKPLLDMTMEELREEVLHLQVQIMHLEHDLKQSTNKNVAIAEVFDPCAGGSRNDK